jgi:hypothetical protein
MATYYPPVGFHFLVEFEGLGTESKDHQFQSVSGLSVDIETEEIAEKIDSNINFQSKPNTLISS